jgi:protoporphyrin/coproporphyrin ferrochelatase
MSETTTAVETPAAVAEEPPVAENTTVSPPAPNEAPASQSPPEPVSEPEPEPAREPEPTIAPAPASEPAQSGATTGAAPVPQPTADPEPQPTPTIAPAPASESVQSGATASAAPAAATEAVTAPAAEAARAAGIGVLLVNLGTPEAATPAAVRKYLQEFLTDKRVIETDTLLWKLVLNGIILPLRSRRKARDYEKIWNHEKDESPFKTITRAQAQKLGNVLEPIGKHLVVSWAMRYGEPSIASQLEALMAQGCDRILIMPLYPQYAAATTATVCDEAFRFLMRQRRQPAIRVLPPYYDDPYYIEVLASTLKAEIKALPFKPDVIVASYHGLPKESSRKGDPYESQCVHTTELLREQMGLDASKLMLTYQSRFGRAKWLEPYTIKTMKALAKKGVKNLAVITPGFSADCLETLEEIAVENAHVFKRYGGENFVAIPCLNDSEAGMLLLWRLAMRELKGWV